MIRSRTFLPLRIPAFLVSILLIFPLILSGCGPENEKTNHTDGSSASGETEPVVFLDSLPEGMDFGGSDLVILSDSSIWIKPENSKEIVDSAQTTAYNNITERLNVNLVYHEIAVSDNTWDPEREILQRNAMSGLFEFDMITSESFKIAPLATSGAVIDMAKAENFDYIELDQPWWGDDIFNALTISDHVYWLSGMTTQSNIIGTYGIIFNSDLMKSVMGADYNIYDTVRSGDWTLDTLYDIVRISYVDDGNGEVDPGDRFGFNMYYTWVLDNLAVCAGADFTKRDADNIPYLNMNTERNILINEKLYDLVNCPGYSPYAGGEHYGSHFSEGLLVMYGVPIHSLGGLRDVKFDFGVIPMPKLDTTQEAYLTSLHEYWSVTGIPATVPTGHYEMIFAVSDAFAAETCRVTRPALLDGALKNKYTRDEETKEMIDLLQKHVTDDFFRIYGNTNGIHQFFADNSPDFRDISSILARREKSFRKLLDGYVTAFDKYSE